MEEDLDASWAQGFASNDDVWSRVNLIADGALGHFAGTVLEGQFDRTATLAADQGHLSRFVLEQLLTAFPLPFVEVDRRLTLFQRPEALALLPGIERGIQHLGRLPAIDRLVQALTAAQKQDREEAPS